MSQTLQNCLKILADNRPGWFIEEDILEMARGCGVDEVETKMLLDAYERRLREEKT